MMSQGPDGKTLSYEDVLRSQFEAISQSRKFGSRATQVEEEEQFLESEDWQALLKSKFKAQQDGKDGVGSSAVRDSSTRESTVSDAKRRPSRLADQLAGVAKDPKKVTTPRGEDGRKSTQVSSEKGSAYFVKLLQMQQSNQNKKRDSAKMAAEQAENLASKL